jgi:hypothetical protein
LSPSGRNRFGVPTPRNDVRNTATERRRPKAAPEVDAQDQGSNEDGE